MLLVATDVRNKMSFGLPTFAADLDSSIASDQATFRLRFCAMYV